jgi:CheY-like chemotaxis protein
VPLLEVYYASQVLELGTVRFPDFPHFRRHGCGDATFKKLSCMEKNGHIRILLVDDHEVFRRYVSSMLKEQANVQIVGEAEDGLQAVRQAQVLQPDVILLDIGLPGMSGWEIAAWVTEQPAEKRPLLVAITGYGREEDRQRSEEAGIDLHLVKPVDPAELLRLLKRFHRVVGG